MAWGEQGEGALDHAFVAGLTVVKSEVVDLRCADRTVVSDHLGLDLHVALD
jgi:endonuclease/exonuclease/phosphatase family metal-dependent hydrolase